jgi:hypothetical protein
VVDATLNSVASAWFICPIGLVVVGQGEVGIKKDESAQVES